METVIYDRVSEFPRQFVPELRLIYSASQKNKDEKVC